MAKQFLHKRFKAMLVDAFRRGESIASLSLKWEVDLSQVEQVIRQALSP